jgi:TatD DNase family protein
LCPQIFANSPFQKSKSAVNHSRIQQERKHGKRAFDAGFYLSFGKAALDNLSLQKLIEDFPVQKMFLETDDADFEIAKLYEKVSEIKCISLEELKNQMWENLENVINYG